MGKIKISHKQKESIEKMSKQKIKKSAQLKPYNPTEDLLDENFIGKAILECLKNNDPEGVMEVLSVYLKTVNKVKSAQRANIARSTLYHSIKSKNPTIKTLAKLVSIRTLESRIK